MTLLSLLDPRLWLATALALALSFGAGYFKGFRHADKQVRLEWTAAVASANAEARQLEQARQRRADEAAKLGAAREAGIRADAARARGSVDGLRGDLAALRARAQSLTAALDALSAVGDVLQSCGAEYQRVAEQADRAFSEVRTLREAWPK